MNPSRITISISDLQEVFLRKMEAGKIRAALEAYERADALVLAQTQPVPNRGTLIERMIRGMAEVQSARTAA